MYQWLVFAHVLGVFGFLLAHGTAVAVAFALPRQREVERVRVLLDLSRGVTMVANVSLLVLLAAGITAGFMGNWWGQGWIWAALGLFILIGVTMTLLGSRPLNRIRRFSAHARSIVSVSSCMPAIHRARRRSVIRPWTHPRKSSLPFCSLPPIPGFSP